MLIHQTVLDIQTKRYLLLYKVTIKNPPYSNKDSPDQYRYKNQYQKKTLFWGVGFKKNLGMGSIHFLEEGWEIVKFFKGGFRGHLDVQKYRHTDRK